MLYGGWEGRFVNSALGLFLSCNDYGGWIAAGFRFSSGVLKVGCMVFGGRVMDMA